MLKWEWCRKPNSKNGSSGKWHSYKVFNTAIEVVTDVYKQILEDGSISNTEYNKLIKMIGINV